MTRSAERRTSIRPAVPAGKWNEKLCYSAMTFNAHRIHYDRDYATREEGYPGLVVHGPLQATLLLDLAGRMRRGDLVREFSFRGVRPLFDLKPFTLCGQFKPDGAMALRVIGNGGEVTMRAEASW
jgi:3-methylfumaryl-CoA hydratase